MRGVKEEIWTTIPVAGYVLTKVGSLVIRNRKVNAPLRPVLVKNRYEAVLNGTSDALYDIDGDNR